MKRTILTFGIFSLIINLCFCQEHKLDYLITYDLKYQSDSTDASSIRAEKMWLLSGDEASLFISQGQALKDSLQNSANISLVGTEAWKEKARATKTNFSFRIFKDRSLSKLYHAEKIFQDKLFYSQPISTISWKIHPESKEFLGYSVQKATTSFAGREYTAWFSPAIPIPDGPYKFSGLPGLILSLEDSDQEYIFSFAGIEKLKTAIDTYIPPKDFQEATKTELIELKKRYEKDPIKYVNNYVGSGGKTIRIEVPESEKKRLRKQREADKNHNPIERQ